MNTTPLSRILAYWTEKYADAPAIVIDDESITWAELDRTTNRLARAYADLGVGQDDFVTVALQNGVEFVQACFAAWKLGATPQPISWRLPKIERDAIVELAKPALVVGIDDADSAAPCVPVGFAPSASLSDEALDARIASNVKAVTSGGSTGRPKLIVAPTPAVWDHDVTYLTVPHESRVLVPGPLYHNGPFMWTMCALCQGNQVVLVKKFDAETTLSIIQEHRIENMYAVPTMMQRIWNLPEATRTAYDLSSLQSLMHMAAPCPAWLKEAFIEWLGPNVIWELYGGAEGQGATVITGEEWLEHRGSVGKPVPEAGEMCIFDEEGNALPPGETGEVFMRPATGAGSTYTYIGAESRQQEGGWESLGDMGWMDEDGYLYLADRRTDMILCGGSNVYPAEVEAAIDAFPGVRSSAVIGLPHDDMGNAVHAIVDAPASSPDPEALLAFLRARLVTYKLPRSFEFVREPLRDDAGKVRRKALRDARMTGAN